MSSETRIVRPFFLPSRVGRLFKGVRLRFGATICGPGGRIESDDPEEYLRSVPALLWAEDDASFAAFKRGLEETVADCGMDPDAAALVVTAYTNYLKITDVLVNRPIAQIDELRHEKEFHSDRGRALRASTHGATIRVYLVLSRNLPRKALRPWRKGTWLAAATFRIRTATERQLFRPIPLDAKAREELGLPRRCLQYLQLDDHDPLGPYRASAAPRFYVDADVLARIDRSARTPVGRALQLQMARDFVAGVIMDVAACRADELSEPAWEELKDSLFGRIVTMAVGRRAPISERERFIRQVAKGNPGRLLAQFEDALNLSGGIGNALAPDE